MIWNLIYAIAGLLLFGCGYAYGRKIQRYRTHALEWRMQKILDWSIRYQCQGYAAEGTPAFDAFAAIESMATTALNDETPHD